jgi:glyoxylase I family protein
MEKVLGFGGFFFRARDPEALAKWYNDLLGVRQTAPDYGHAYWIQERGPTVFEPFPEDTDYFGESGLLTRIATMASGSLYTPMKY